MVGNVISVILATTWLLMMSLLMKCQMGWMSISVTADLLGCSHTAVCSARSNWSDKVKTSAGAAVLRTEAPCWWERWTENGQTGSSRQNNCGYQLHRCDKRKSLSDLEVVPLHVSQEQKAEAGANTGSQTRTAEDPKDVAWTDGPGFYVRVCLAPGCFLVKPCSSLVLQSFQGANRKTDGNSNGAERASLHHSILTETHQYTRHSEVVLLKERRQSQDQIHPIFYLFVYLFDPTSLS